MNVFLIYTFIFYKTIKVLISCHLTVLRNQIYQLIVIFITKTFRITFQT